MSVVVEGKDRVYMGAQAWLVEENRELAWAEKHVVTNPALKYVLGRFVEANNANQNGHIFDLKELEVSQRYLANSPLNMLHRPHYIVGNYVAAELIYPIGEAAATGSEPFMEALASFYRYYFPEEYMAIEKAHADGALYFCVDEQTELLSADGWKRYDQLQPGEEILTLNRATGLSEWLPLEQLHVYPHDGELISMEGDMHSSFTTPNHRWWVERRPHRDRTRSDWQWRTTESLTQETSIPRAVPHADFPVTAKYEDALVELEGWFWTEGTDPGYGVVIYQSHAKNPLNCDRIAACLTRLYGMPGRVRDGGMWYRTDHGRMAHFHLCSAAARPLRELGGKVPAASFVRALTESQLRLFIETSLAGDGDNASSGQQGIKQNSLAAARVFEMACALVGIPTNTSLCKDGQWRCGLIRRSNRITPVVNAQRRSGFVIERRPHHGVVWCPETQNQTFLARRRGTVYWTGNSMECVPRSVVCKADGGCGQEFDYDGRTSPSYCSHLNEPAAKKLLHQPLFTGGALILPPVAPGWRNADVTSLSSLLAERQTECEMAYNQLSDDLPHLGPKEWEAMMAQIVVGSTETRTPMLGYGLYNDYDLSYEMARDFNTEKRKSMAKQGTAMPDGSFPIANVSDLKNAIQAFGRAAASKRAAVKRHIKKRANALGASNLIPEGW